MKKIIAEFKAFAMRGNVIDLAVAVVIGTAFGKIVSSLVANIITPSIGVIMGGIDFTGLEFKFGHSVITYGVFVQSVVDFLIVSAVLFFAIKAATKLKVNAFEEPKEEKVEEIPENILLLREIRDSLRK